MHKSKLFVIASLFGAACSGMAMRAPSELASNGALLVASDRQKWGVNGGRGSFVLGPYQVHDVKRFEVAASGYSVFGFGKRKLRTGYDYGFHDASHANQAHCEQEQDGTGASFAGKLECRCGEADAAVEIGRKASAGTLHLEGQSYRMSALRERESGGSSDEPLGYRVDGAEPLGAVELEGRVWTRRALGEPAHSQLVCLLSGLLLYRPIPEPRPSGR